MYHVRTWRDGSDACLGVEIRIKKKLPLQGTYYVHSIVAGDFVAHED